LLYIHLKKKKYIFLNIKNNDNDNNLEGYMSLFL
jgi:hypothetical protein